MQVSIRLDRDEARALLRAVAAQADKGDLDENWFRKVELLSRLCEEGGSRTHIAFLGTAMLAKAMRLDVDLFAIKPQHAGDNRNAYSARTLCHGVLVPLAADLGISIGVTGREPLNNQPYFRMTRLDDGTPVQRASRPAFNEMVRLVTELGSVSTEEEARAALAAFVAERRRYRPRYAAPEGEVTIGPEDLPAAVRALVQRASENGRRAQAAVAGLMDAFAGPERVESGRINDPSRRHPGDVCVRAADNPDAWEKTFEVRDKPVSLSDIQIFGIKCLNMGVREAAVVAVADGQAVLDFDRLSEWAAELDLGMTVFMNWESIVEQALFWAEDPKPVTARRAVGYIHERLIAVEASPGSVELWAKLTRRQGADT